MAAHQPTLWHIPVSHYSEKVRWALDWKGVAYRRLAPPPGAHMGFALALTRGKHKTFPVLRLNGRSIGDSSAIILALERAYAERPLLPTEKSERTRALDLEEFFDEELGPYGRHLAFHEMRSEPDVAGEFAATLLPKLLAGNAAVRSGMGRIAVAYSGLRYSVGEEGSAEQARTKILTALDRLEAELAKGDGIHLVGDRFTVADLTAASMFTPLVAPPEGPPLPSPPAGIERFRAPLRDRPGYRWVESTFTRYRSPLPAA